MKTLLLTLLFPFVLDAQITTIQNAKGELITGITPEKETFVIHLVKDGETSEQFYEFLNDRLKRYSAGAIVYEKRYDITIEVFPLHKEKVLIIRKNNKLCYYRN